MYLCSFRICQKSAPSRKQIDSMYVFMVFDCHRKVSSWQWEEFWLVEEQANAGMKSVGIPVGNGWSLLNTSFKEKKYSLEMQWVQNVCRG
jgi:hypothetical protein